MTMNSYGKTDIGLRRSTNQDTFSVCDLPGGDYRTLLSSLKRICDTLVGDYRVLSGHGEETTLDIERKYNPYFRG